MLRSISKQSRESVVSVLKKKNRLQQEGFAEKEGFTPAMKEWGGDGWWEWSVDGTDVTSATYRTQVSIANAFEDMLYVVLYFFNLSSYTDHNYEGIVTQLLCGIQILLLTYLWAVVADKKIKLKSLIFKSFTVVILSTFLHCLCY